jgi:hypothetical protein
MVVIYSPQPSSIDRIDARRTGIAGHRQRVPVLAAGATYLSEATSLGQRKRRHDDRAVAARHRQKRANRQRLPRVVDLENYGRPIPET